MSKIYNHFKMPKQDLQKGHRSLLKVTKNKNKIRIKQEKIVFYFKTLIEEDRNCKNKFKQRI